MDVKKLEQRLGITIKDRSLFEQAFTHTSYVHEHRRNGLRADNERLEFLGDAVLELVVSDYLFRGFPKMDEGRLTRIRSRIVCESSLASFARDIHLGDYIFLGKGEEMTGGRLRSSLLADVFEAFVGALFLDQGLEGVQQFLNRVIFPKIDDQWLSSPIDAKSQLQEIIQQEKKGILEYKTVDIQGPAHDREFVVEVYLENRCIGRGSGRSKKEAEQQAATEALQLWQKRTE